MWPITAYACNCEIQTNLRYGHPLFPGCPDKRGVTVLRTRDLRSVLNNVSNLTGGVLNLHGYANLEGVAARESGCPLYMWISHIMVE